MDKNVFYITACLAARRVFVFVSQYVTGPSLVTSEADLPKIM